MNTFKKMGSIVMMLALVLCVSVSFASCDLINSIIGHECADADNNHLCDTCEESLSECADADKNHNCDVCGKALTQCADTNSDHKCDTCGATVSACADNDPKDHYCDVCDAELSDCYVDDDFDHLCDGCGMVLGECYDGDKDHDCDYCGAAMGGECADGDDEGHNCDYCGTNLCADGEDEDHNCDVCGANLCVDADEDCDCDVCEAPLHVDANLDHECDKCKGASGEHADTNADTDHDCDYCYKSVCADGDDADHNCDECGANLCVDLKNNETNEEGSDHKCDTCGAKVCYDGGDRDHACDVCREVLCADADNDHKCDACGELVCSGCETHTAPVVSVYVEGANCTVNGSNVVKFYSLDEVVAVTPSYTATQYVIDLWVVYNGEGTKIAYIENGSAFVPTEGGKYYIAPIFIANNLGGIADADASIDVSDGTQDKIDESSILPEWADEDASKKLFIFGSEGHTNNVLASSPNAQLYLTTDPTDAANVVVMFATRNGATGGLGNTVIETPIDADSKGYSYAISFDYYLDHNCSSADSTTIMVVKDSNGAEFKIAVIVPAGKSMASATTDTATPTEGAFRFQSRHYNTAGTGVIGNDGVEYKDSAGSEKILLSSDTWYTLSIDIKNNVISTYWSLRGSDVRTLIQEYDFSNFSINERELVSFKISAGLYNNSSLSYFDNIYFGRGHNCEDADNNHNCDTCEKALCYDGIDADHNCDRCGANLCADGEIKDHYCDDCGAQLSECVETVIDHYCDICGEWKYGGDAHVDGEDAGHDCDYCSANMCVDADKNHVCDVCNATGMGGECADADKDHNCDYCGERKFGSVEGSTDCADANTDHKCDWCGKEGMGEHADATGDGDHVCDYGCKAVLTECVDADTNYKCDECGVDLCYDLDNDHICDIEAHKSTGEKISECVDENKDHICDFAGCKKALSECADGETVDHVCDYCGKYNVAWCADTNNNHLCDLEACNKIVSYCADTNADHKCDKCGKDVCTDANGDRICDSCSNVVAYNFETGSIETSGNLALLTTASNVNKLSNFTADQIAAATKASTTITTEARPEGYNYATWISLGVDPENAANQVLSLQTTRVEGGGTNAPSYATATPVIVDADGTYTVMKFRMYIGTVDGSKNAYHDVLYLYMIDEDGTSKKATVGYRGSTASTNAAGNTVYSISSCGKAISATTDMWIDLILVNDNTAKKYYGYYSVDGGKTYTYANGGTTGLKSDIASIKFEANAYQVNSLALVDDWSNVRVSSVSIPLADGTTAEHAAPAAE